MELKYIIRGNAEAFVNKHKSHLSQVKKAELIDMLKDFAVGQVQNIERSKVDSSVTAVNGDYTPVPNRTANGDETKTLAIDADNLVKKSDSLPCVSMRDLYGELREMGIPADYADKVAGWAKTL